MVMERIPADTWDQHPGHVARYQYAAQHVRKGDRVNDIACGTGYGAVLLPGCRYRGYDRPGVPDTSFPGDFRPADLDDPYWAPARADVTVCFETLEHVKDPARLARVIATTTGRTIFSQRLSVGVVAMTLESAVRSPAESWWLTGSYIVIVWPSTSSAYGMYISSP